ncbi:chromosome segregation ATPase [Candidatus Mancarchaeum acidiphilum]|uniref:Chromosome segregation ATPase n=1 Tax=Candidatus Mancarchaeum acidiphilum TaxID=1920749 RepID=A0A218NNS2_9ARCH|nr:AAA family ATPase [Candidatus Mancarchaeum acidiphilum]ASI14127.1 chromosome segregation ATPase [Candidatus Mancarchaeum acidiphilum]
MLYIDKIHIRNFKSFKNSSTQFTNGFNCIVGANGAGKSNICDSLLFALGETSLKRMRVSKTKDLLNSLSLENSKSKKTASVSITFSGSSSFEIYRSVDSDGKIEYRLDGKKATRQEIVDMLARNGAVVNETNTITQGEINKIMGLSVKERRYLIDIAAGIKEFDDKREDSLKELGKVDEKISAAKALLGERLGFLNELKKEKDDAEAYQHFASQIKKINYTVLKRRFEEIDSRMSKINEEIKAKNELLSKEKDSLDSLNGKISDLSSKHNEISKEINLKSSKLGSINAAVENANKNIAVYLANISNLNESVKELELSLESHKSDISKISSLIEAESAELAAISKDIESKSNYYKDLESANDAGMQEYKTLQKEYEEQSAKLNSLNSDYTDKKVRLEQLKSEYSSIQSKIATAGESVQSIKEDLSRLDLEKARLSSEISKEGKSISQLKSERIEIGGALDKANIRSINLREQLSSFGGARDSMEETLKSVIKEGFYGRAYELCRYDEKYSEAVNTASGSRMNYFVVDNISTANNAIKVLKRAMMGRASFIPIEEISYYPMQENKMDPLLRHIEYDSKFEKAFAYIFSNTYIIDNIEQAKKLGIGKYRFVTLDGELVEPSGIVTGGRSKSSNVFPGKLRMELEETETTRKGLSSRQAELDELINETFRQISQNQVRLENIDNEIQTKKKLLEQYNSASTVQEKESELKSNLSSLSKEVEMLDSEKSMIDLKIKKLKESMEEKESSMPAKSGVQNLPKLRSEIESLKVDHASKSKEVALNKTKLQELSEELKKVESKIALQKSQIKDFESKLEDEKAVKAENEAIMKAQDKDSVELYNKLSGIEKTIEDLGFEKGRISSHIDQMNREINDLKSGSIESNVRLSDIKAELSTYEGIEEMQGSIEELERKLSEFKSSLSKLGEVNLKAPEMYLEKSKGVEEAALKLNTLDSEKNSIMSMIKEVERKKLEVFNETFSKVNENFSTLHKVTIGTEGRLVLQNPKDPFNSGLNIIVKKESGREANSETLSGGEKSLNLLILLFAILMRDPKSFYIFDEIDSALDKDNSKKLSLLLKKMSERSQFIVVSHNDTLITSADAVIGFVNQNDESRSVAVKLSNLNK